MNDFKTTTTQRHTRNKAFFKIDVEGFECHALAGGKELITSSTLEVLFFEYGIYSVRRCGPEHEVGRSAYTFIYRDHSPRFLKKMSA